MKPVITITYCPKCGWLMRAAWLAQELLTTFGEDLYGVTLHPSETSGHFSVSTEKDVIWDRRTEGRFPEAKELKQRVRDIVAPDKSLGHSDRISSPLSPDS